MNKAKVIFNAAKVLSGVIWAESKRFGKIAIDWVLKESKLFWKATSDSVDKHGPKIAEGIIYDAVSECIMDFLDVIVAKCESIWNDFFGK